MPRSKLAKRTRSLPSLFPKWRCCSPSPWVCGTTRSHWRSSCRRHPSQKLWWSLRLPAWQRRGRIWCSLWKKSQTTFMHLHSFTFFLGSHPSIPPLTHVSNYPRFKSFVPFSFYSSGRQFIWSNSKVYLSTHLVNFLASEPIVKEWLARWKRLSQISCAVMWSVQGIRFCDR